MKLKKTYKIGTMVMFYEVVAIEDFVNSILTATADIENKENITVEFTLNISQYSEKLDESIKTKSELITLFTNTCITPLRNTGLNTTYNIYENDDRLYSIGSYRRDLNYSSCLDYDFIVWGESDCMMPKEYFNVLEQIAYLTEENKINRYCVTFATRKMWDESWAVLEHNGFTSKTFKQSTDPSVSTDPSSIWYYMSQKEMNALNAKAEEYDLRILDFPRFDGSLLTISKDLLLNGINIPPAVQGTGEDTAFQKAITTHMGSAYRQIVVKNILKVHNRNHPKKRYFIAGEDSESSPRDRRSNNTAFDNIHKTSYHNLSIIGSSQEKFKIL